MQMEYQQIVRRVETRTETTVEHLTFSLGVKQVSDLNDCLPEQPLLTQQESEATELISAEQPVWLVLEDIDEEPISPWSPNHR